MDQRRRFLLAGAAASALLPSARVLAASPDRMRLFAGLVPSVSQPGGVLESRALSAVPGGVGDTVEWMPWARAFATAQLGNAYLFPLVDDMNDCSYCIRSRGFSALLRRYF